MEGQEGPILHTTVTHLQTIAPRHDTNLRKRLNSAVMRLRLLMPPDSSEPCQTSWWRTQNPPHALLWFVCLLAAAGGGHGEGRLSKMYWGILYWFLLPTVAFLGTCTPGAWMVCIALHRDICQTSSVEMQMTRPIAVLLCAS
jgi:hypothetical protein